MPGDDQLANSEHRRRRRRWNHNLIHHQWMVRRREYRDHTATTVWPPGYSYIQIRQAAGQVLPGSLWYQHPLWRYVIVWHGPLE